LCQFANVERIDGGQGHVADDRQDLVEVSVGAAVLDVAGGGFGKGAAGDDAKRGERRDSGRRECQVQFQLQIRVTAGLGEAQKVRSVVRTPLCFQWVPQTWCGETKLMKTQACWTSARGTTSIFRHCFY